MKKTLKISVSILLLALAIAVVQIPAAPVAADTSKSSVSDFQMNGTTLVRYTGTAQTVSVPASVKVIADGAFAGNTQMETLKFEGSNLETISYQAFANCTSLKEVVLPDSLISLGNAAFSYCTALTKIEFGNGLSKLGIGTFAGCAKLKEIIIPEENEFFAMDDGCLYSADKAVLYLMLPTGDKDSYSMPATVTDIAAYAFWECENIKTIRLSSNLKTIPEYAFTNCISLTGISIPYSVQSIGLMAFSGCVNLEDVSIPTSVTYIHETAFDSCKKLNIIAESGSVAARFYEDWLKRNPSSSVEELPPTDQQPAGPGDVIGSSSVVGNHAYVMIDNSVPNVYGSGGTQSGGLDNVGLAKGTEIPKYTVAFDSIIADQAFYQNNGMSSYSIPDGITEIGEFAFSRSNLVEARIPYGVKSIDYGAFYHCDYLREVEIPASVTYIAPKAFAETMWLNNWLAGSEGGDFLIVGNGILLAYRGSSSNVVLPDTVKRIAPEAFAGNVWISSVTIPDSVIEIGESAFEGCGNLHTVSGGKNVRIIRDRAFYGCDLQSAHVWENVDFLGLQCFHFSDSLGTSYKVVVFDDSQKLPEPSYELTAERLSNDALRGLVLGDAMFAIVPRGVIAEDLAGTLLSGDANGFKGMIAYISSHDQGIVTCIATTYTQEELETTYIPSYIMIDGKQYQVIGANIAAVLGSDREYNDGVITVQDRSASLSDISASLSGNGGSYYLRVTDSENAYERLQAGYQAVYRQQLPQSVLCTNILLVDQKTGVPITKLGSEQLTMSMTLPESLQGGSLRILETDANGQLENISYVRDGNRVTFHVSHLGSFAFVNVAANSDANVYAQESVTADGTVINSFGNLDDSPDTGDALHPKWFVAVGLFASSLAVLLSKKRR